MTDALDRLRGAQKLGVVFSGGSSRCIFQIGVVETMYDLGLAPAVCLGVSAGAWNAAAVAVGNWRRLRNYWRFFCRMPYVDVGNLLREHSPFMWRRMHERAFRRYVGAERLRAESTLPLYAGVTRLRDKVSVLMDVKASPDPLRLLLASNYLRPFYTHAVTIDGERYGDGGWSNAIPYEALLARGCDAVVVITMKGESEGGLYRNFDDYEHAVPSELADRVVVIRPRHRLPIAFLERRWERLVPFADVGALRAREVLLGERHAETDVAAKGRPFSAHVDAVRRLWR